MEQFVTFNIGKKLKEKGFIHDYNLYGYKPIYTDVNTIALIWNNGAYEKDYFGENIPCPTISQVLKWLREEKKIHIGVLYHNYYAVWIQPMKRNEAEHVIHDCKTHEGAELEGIEFVLDNLI